MNRYLTRLVLALTGRRAELPAYNAMLELIDETKARLIEESRARRYAAEDEIRRRQDAQWRKDRLLAGEECRKMSDDELRGYLQ